MKTSTRILSLAAFLLGAAALAFAGPPPVPVNVHKAMSAEQMEQLKAGDKIAYVCKECNSVSVQTIEKSVQAMALCKEGAVVTCPSCKKVFKVVRSGPPGKGSTPFTQVRYVNPKGEECMFIAKLDK